MLIKKIIFLSIFVVYLQNTFAQTPHDSIQKLLKKEKKGTKKVDLLIALAISYNRKSTDSAIHIANNALEKARKIDYLLGIADAHNILAWANFRQSYYKKADSLSQIAINYYTQLDNVSIKLGNSYRLLAAINIEEKKFDDALKHLLKVKDIYDVPSLNNNDIKIYVINEIAYLYLEMDNYVMAMKYLNESIASAKANEKSIILADCYFILGIINSKQGNYQKSTEYFNLSKKTYLKKNDQLSIVGCNSKIGINFYNDTSYKKAITYLTKAKEQSAALSYNFGVMENLVYIGKSHTKLGNLTKAKAHLNEAKNIAKKHGIATSEIVLAEAELALKKQHPDKAIELIETHLSSNVSINLKAKTELYNSLSEAYSLKNDYKKALNTKNQLIRIQDRTYSVQKAIQVNVLQAEFDYTKVKNDLKRKEAELKVSEEKSRSTQLFYSLIAIAAASLFVISTLIYLKRKESWKTKQALQASKQQQLDNEIDFKNKQLTDFAIHISEKNELLTTIKNKIKAVNITDKTENTKLSDVIFYVNNNLEHNKEKVALYSFADNTKDAFYHKLSDLYPSLTPKEKKVATFVRLDLTSKQIAIQMNISISSIDNYRYNLRKKMNVAKEISLSNFLKNI